MVLMIRNILLSFSHASHRAIAAWALGANADTIHNAYKRDCQYEKPAIKSPEPISVINFNEHLGDDRLDIHFISLILIRIHFPLLKVLRCLYAIFCSACE